MNNTIQEQVNNQLEHILALCNSYVEGDELEDVGNIRALYEEYAEWIDNSKVDVIWLDAIQPVS